MGTVQMISGAFQDLGRFISKKVVKIRGKNLYIYKFEMGEIASAKKL